MSSPRAPDACPRAPPDHGSVTAVNTPQRARQRAGACGCVSALGPRGPVILSKDRWDLSCISSPASDSQPGWELRGSQAAFGWAGAPGSGLRGPQTLRGQGWRGSPRCHPWRSPPPIFAPKRGSWSPTGPGAQSCSWTPGQASGGPEVGPSGEEPRGSLSASHCPPSRESGIRQDS